MSLFGNPNTSKPAGTSLFGNTAATGSGGGLFGGASTTATSSAPGGGGLFGNAQASTGGAPAGGGLFGNATANTGTGGGLFGNQQGANQTAGAASQPAVGGGLFGGAAAKPAQTGGLFGTAMSNRPAGAGSLFGAPTNQNANKPSIFGASSGAPGFGASSAQNPQPGQSIMQPAAPDLGQSMMDSRRIWNEEDGAPRSRTVLEQLQLVDKKWDPANSQHAFQTYLYNQVQPDAQPFYRPAPGESEEAWEEALRKAPNPGAIPFRVKGFYELGVRIVSQRQHLDILSGRLHEINNGLTALLRKHELEIASRTTEARRRHAALSQRVLTLATKTMMARNRGYALDSAEEELRKKLVTLERGVLDPALSGREEEIWARMVSVREKGRLLEAELQRAGLTAGGGQDQEISEETMKQARKILEDYDSQLNHLTKELAQITTDLNEWESTKSSSTITNGR